MKTSHKILALIVAFFFIGKNNLNAVNDSIVFFLYADGNNNAVYEPGIGEKPLINYCLTFTYTYNISATGYWSGVTDNNGYFRVKNMNNLVLPAQNMLSRNTGAPFDQQYNSAIFANPTNFAYNTVHQIPLYSPYGFKRTNLGSLALGNSPGWSAGYNAYCLGRTNLYVMTNGYMRNYIDVTPVNEAVTYTITDGVTSNVYTQTVTVTWSPNSLCNWGTSILLNTPPELTTMGTYTIYYNGTLYSNMGINDGYPYLQGLAVIVDSCATVTGLSTFVDCNANCYKDGAEMYAQDEVIISTNGTYSTMAIPDYNGNYNVISPYSATQYSLTVVPNSGFAMTCSVNPNSYYFSNGATNITRVDKLVQSSVNNLNTYAYENNPHSGSSVPGGNFVFDAFYGITHPAYCTGNSGTFYVKLDPAVQLTTLAAGTPTNYTAFSLPSGDSLVWNFADLRLQAANLTGTLFSLNLKMKTTATIGNSYCIKSGVVSTYTETNITDNVFNKCWVIGGPFDPNDKSVTPAGTTSLGIVPMSTSELVYHINFQNCGTAPAINVKIKDQLDNNLDWNTIEILGSSFPVQTNISGTGQATFLFDNILLPDSNVNEKKSHGFVTYKIKLKPSLPIGTTIKNTAGIYFDYNAPVNTNTTVTTLSVTVTGVNELASSDLKIYPNPTTGVFTIESKNVSIKKIKIYNLIGEEVRFEVQMKNEKPSIDLSTQSKGVYFVELTDNSGQSIIKKLIVQ